MYFLFRFCLYRITEGIKVKIVVTEMDSLSVDTPEDLEKARIFYRRLQRAEKNKQ